MKFLRIQSKPNELNKGRISTGLLSTGLVTAAALLILAVSISCNLSTLLVSQKSPTQAAAEGPLGLIAYVGTDGNIYTIDRDGKQQTALTQDAKPSSNPGEAGLAYMYPTWAPNGFRLAFTGFSTSTQGITQANLYTITSDGKKRVEAFSSQESLPFYFFWSPDSKYVSFLSSSPAGNDLTLNLSAAAGGDSKIIGTGQPYYWDWSPDNRAIITHTGGAAAENPDASLAIYQLDGSIQKKALDLKPGAFQAPAWSPGGEDLILEAENASGGEELILTSRDGTLKKVLAKLDSQAYFAWSPKGNLLAYITSTPDDPSGLSRRLVLLDPTKPEAAKDIAKGILVAFFWSPDSQKIAYFVPSSGNQQGNAPQLIQANTGIKLDLQIYDLASGKITQASTFTPTDSFLQVFPYFDQYQRSGTIWSPDSKTLVLAGLDDKQGASIFVVSADGSKIQRIAGGNLAFWSWK